MTSLPTFDAVLLPTEEIGRRSVEASRILARNGTEFTLRDGEFYPHLSLYMGNFSQQNLWAAELLLVEIAKETLPLRLKAERYTQDLEQGMIEVTYENTGPITHLQKVVISALNPLRRGLRERDPVGRVLRKWLPTTTGEVRENLEQYGYDEIGSHFRPHITFSRFIRRDLRVDTADLPLLAAYDGVFPRLGLFEMGEHGTCIRRVVELELGNQPGHAQSVESKETSLPLER